MISFIPKYPQDAIWQLNQWRSDKVDSIRVLMQDNQMVAFGHFSKFTGARYIPKESFDKLVICYPVSYRMIYGKDKVVYDWSWPDSVIQTNWWYNMVTETQIIRAAVIGVYPEKDDWLYNKMVEDKLDLIMANR